MGERTQPQRQRAHHYVLRGTSRRQNGIAHVQGLSIYHRYNTHTCPEQMFGENI